MQRYTAFVPVQSKPAARVRVDFDAPEASTPFDLDYFATLEASRRGFKLAIGELTGSPMVQA